MAVLVFSVIATAQNHHITQQVGLRFNSTLPKDFSIAPVYLDYFLVPESWVQIEADKIVESQWLPFLRNSQHPGFVAVPVHPFDRVNPKLLSDALINHGYDGTKHKMDTIFLVTESRSLYPQKVNPGEIPMSPRLSITDGLGKWGGREKENSGGMEYETLNKLISPKQAQFALIASRLIEQRLHGVSAQYFEIQPERMILTVRSPDEKDKLSLGATFRDIRSSTYKNQIAVAGFVGTDTEGGMMLALANDRLSLMDYLENVEAPLRGRAWAEFIGLTGFVHSSPHSQNILINLDESLRAKGTISIRDLPDLIPEYDARQSDPELNRLMNQFEDARESLRLNLDGGEKSFIFRHSFLKGNESPSLTNVERAERAALDAFLEQLAKMAGVSYEELKEAASYKLTNLNTEYAQVEISRQSPIWQRVREGLIRYRSDFITTPSLPSLALKAEPGFLSEKHPKIRNFLRQLLIQRFKNQPFSENQLAYCLKIWELRSRMQLSSAELSWIAQILLVTKTLPIHILPTLLPALKSAHAEKLLYKEIIASEKAEAILNFIKIAEKSNLDNYLLENFRYELWTRLEKSSSLFENRKGEIATALFFNKMNSLKNNRERQTDCISFYGPFKRLGFLPIEVRNEVMRIEAAVGASDNTKMLLSVPSPKPLACGQLF